MFVSSPQFNSSFHFLFIFLGRTVHTFPSVPLLKHCDYDLSLFDESFFYFYKSQNNVFRLSETTLHLSTVQFLKHCEGCNVMSENTQKQSKISAIINTFFVCPMKLHLNQISQKKLYAIFASTQKPASFSSQKEWAHMA